jgi:predicted Zn-dependent protease
MQGSGGEAMKHYNAAVKNEPGHRLAHFHLGRLLANQRRYPEAIEHLKQTLLPEDANTPGYLYALGAVYGRSGNRARSVDLMTRAREKAAALGQSRLVASIEKDLTTLGAR